jgi:type IV pilus assembly protein PilE
MKRFAAGVTLLELMIVVVIVAILAGIAIPNYRQYVMRANRSDATAALLRIASAQEKVYLQANTYTNNLTAAPPTGLGVQGGVSEHGWYTLTIANPAVGDLTNGFTATATPVAGTVQAADTRCASFTINETGQRTASDSASALSTAECWR